MRGRPRGQPPHRPHDRLTPQRSGDDADTHQYVDVTVAAALTFPGVEGDLQRALGDNLRAFREARALSQEAFADLLGVHRTYVGAIVRGDRNLSLRSVERLADRLGLSALTLLQPLAAEPGAPVRRRRARQARRPGR